MKQLCIVILILGVGHTMMFGHEKLTYRITSGKNVDYESYLIKEEENGYSITLDENVFRFDRGFGQIYWKYYDRKREDSFVAKRKANRIALSGIFRGKPVKKEYTIDGKPWTQCAHFSLQVFTGSKQSVMHYWYISPHDLQLFEIEARKIKNEKIKIGNESEEVLNIRIRPTGFAGNFWYGDYWYRKKDNLYVRYKAIHGPPGTPPTIKELYGEKNLPVDIK
jgi:hypothetical protein